MDTYSNKPNAIPSEHTTANGSPQHPPQHAPQRENREHRDKVDVIKVSANSRSTSVAGAIAGVVREHGRAEVQAIGAGAVNQSMKAAAIARGYLLLDGINVVIIPSFSDVAIDGSERTAIRLTIEPR
jgi:stage V sporulation protein S